MSIVRSKPQLKLVPHKNQHLLALCDELKLFTEDGNLAGTSGRLGVYTCYQRQSLCNVTNDGPTVMFIVNGAKILTVEERTFHATSGEILLLPAGTKFDVENMPDATSRSYLGLALKFDQTTIDLFQKIYGEQFEEWDLSPRWRSKGHENITAALVHWLSWSRQFSPDLGQTRHRQVELLLLLAKQGLAGNLLLYKHPDIRKRVMQLLMLDPAKHWKMDEVCTRLATSESSLRRHLREANSSFRMLLEDVRLNHGIWLIMESQSPISQIAFECGYQSQSRFTERFKLRFNMTPSELRNTQSPLSSNLENSIIASGFDR